MNLRSEQRGNPSKIVPFSYKRGQSGNPGGRPKSAPFRRAVEAVMEAKKDIGDGKKAPRIKILLEAAYDKALIQLKSSPTGLQDVMPFLITLRDTTRTGSQRSRQPRRPKSSAFTWWAAK